MRKPCAVFALSLLLLAAASLGAQDSSESLPKLISHADAIYPAIAKTAHVMGDVVVRITTDGQSVVDAQAESGPPLLQRASVDNAKTWKFAPHTPGTFHVTYRFKIMDGDVAMFPNAGNFVEVAGAPQFVTDVGSDATSMGNWKAELTGPHGRFSETFEFFSTGPGGEQLDFRIRGETDEQYAEEKYGSVNGNLLTFITTLVQPDRRHLKTCLAGRMTRNKIVGTFVDESGVRGTWTATRIPDSEKK